MTGTSAPEQPSAGVGVGAGIGAYRTVPPWTHMPCDECGMEHLASRGEPKASARFICEACETRERAAMYAAQAAAEEMERREVTALAIWNGGAP